MADVEMVDFFAGTPLAALYSGSDSLYNGDPLPGVLDLLSFGLDVTGAVTAGVAKGNLRDVAECVTSWGVGWLIEHLDPLTRLLDGLGGSPAAVRDFSATLTAASDTLRAMDVGIAPGATLWTGEASEAHAKARDYATASVQTLVHLLQGKAVSLEQAAVAVDAVRTLIRSVISDLVAKAARNLSLSTLAPVAGQFLVGVEIACDALQEAKRLRQVCDAVVLLLNSLDDALRDLLAIVGDVTTSLAKEVLGNAESMSRASRSAWSSSTANGLRYAEEQP